MGANKVVIGSLLVALALVGSVAAEKKCENPSGKDECSHDLKKDEVLHIKCPGDTIVPSGAFSALDSDVCKKKLTEFTDTCTGNDVGKLNVLVPGVKLVYPEANKKYEFKIHNEKELTSDVSVYASCKGADDKGFLISIKFLKGGSSDASTRATMPAIMLGALATLFVMSRA